MSKQFHEVFDDMVTSKVNIKFCGVGEMSPTIICIFIYDPGVMFSLTNKSQICTWTKILELRNGWKLNVNYKEVQSWGYLYIELKLWIQLRILIDFPPFQNDVTCLCVNGEILCDSVQYFLGGSSYSFGLGVVDMKMVSLLLCCREKLSLFGDIWLTRFVVMLFAFIARSLVVCRICVKPLTIILTLEDKGGLKGTERDGVGMGITWTTLTNVNVIAMVSSIVMGDICVACVRDLFGAFDPVGHE
ncbi:hypothetical protein RND81_07G087000 [Saponaria officinalis]|uniref:Transmembrane protein n=1 Tax=Saponaria officinalis TaxID=3572 RepID=A0AAW1JNA0_SAPOF